MRRKQRTQEEQMKLIRECRQSGLTSHEWCVKNAIQPKTFYNWVYKMKRKEGIDIPADIATGIQGEPKQPDIAKLEIEADILGQFPVPPLVGRETQRPAASSSTERPVMEVIVGNIQLKVTNEIEPRMLVETIRLLRGCEC